jgi:hypothetical protein
MAGLVSAQGDIQRRPDIRSQLSELQSGLAAHFVASAEKGGMTADQINAMLKNIAGNSAIEEFWIANGSGHAYLTNTGADFTFSRDLGKGSAAGEPRGKEAEEGQAEDGAGRVPLCAANERRQRARRKEKVKAKLVHRFSGSEGRVSALRTPGDPAATPFSGVR